MTTKRSRRPEAGAVPTELVPTNTARTHDSATMKRYQVVCVALVSTAILTVSLWGGMLYDRVNPNPELSEIMNLIGFPLAALLSVSALAAALWFDRGRWQVGAMSIGAGGLVAWCAASIFGSPHMHASLTTFAILAAAAALGWTLYAARLPANALLGAAMALVVAASIVGGLGISEYLSHIARPPRDYSWRVFSTFATPNFLAGYLVMTIPVTAACLLAARERMLRLLCGMGLAIQAACLLLTGSRFGLVSLAAALVTFAVLVTRRGLVQGVAGRRGKVLGAAILAVALLGAIPVGLRLFRSGAESHSTLFRFYTWKGTARMAMANPLLGAGLGSFDVAHAPYAEVAYTQHAHNTYLQLAAESGFPALAFFVLAGGLALTRAIRGARVVSNPPDRSDRTGPGTAIWAGYAPALLNAGLAAGIVGALLRNLFDSDLYVPATALTFSFVCALPIAFSVSIPIVSAHRSWIKRTLAVAGVAVIISLLVPRVAGRVFARAAESALIERDLGGATALYKQAAMADFGNQEYLLKLAGLQDAAGDVSSAEQTYQGALRWAEAGKAYYQYARFLSHEMQTSRSIDVHERARAIEPNNLQNLLALAEAYAMESRKADAERVYRHIAELYILPFGQVRAVPELIEYEFGEAYRALGEIERARGNSAAAERNLRRAVEILGEFWARRKIPMVQLQVRPEKALLAGKRYEESLILLADLLRDSDRREEATALDIRRSDLLAEMEQDKTASQSADQP